MIEKQIDSGLIDVLLNDLIPRLIKEIPTTQQPTKEELDADPLLHRFIIIFDREGSSYDLFQKLWDKHRVACMTYAKNVKESWKESELKALFTAQTKNLLK